MKIWLALTLSTFCGAAFAQTTPAKLEWPRSFTGQPDFAFTRDEAFAEARARAAREGTPAPVIPTLLTLANDEQVPDPLRLTVISSTPVLGGLEGEAGASGTTVTAGVSLLDKLLGTMNELPAYATPTTLQVGEYQTSIQQLISNTVASWKPDAARYDFGSVLDDLTLQAVVTSPQQYAVINGTRYEVGSSFVLRVPLTVPDAEIMAALEAATPPSGALDEATMVAYQTVREEALAAYAAARNLNAKIGQQVLQVPVVLERIEPRRVMLRINGQQHPLVVRYAY